LYLPVEIFGQENISRNSMMNETNPRVRVDANFNLPSNQSSDLPNVSSKLKCKNSTDISPASVSIDTDKTTYAPGQGILPFIYIYNSEGCLIPAKVLVEMINARTLDKIFSQTSFSTTQSGLINDGQQIYVDEPGDYNLTATIDINSKEQIAWKIISIKEIFETRQSFMWLIGLIFFSCLLFVILKGTKDPLLNEVLRFVFISGIIFSVLLSFIFINENISAFSPIGVVKKPITDLTPQTSDSSSSAPSDNSGSAPPMESSGEPFFVPESSFGEGQWVLNIGGQAPDYIYGVQIPITVVIFGITGGYLRYLYKTSKLKDNLSLLKEQAVSRNWMFYHSLEDISLLFLAPILAIAVWFILDQAGIKGQSAINTISITSFAIGLITDEVIQTLIRVSGSALGLKEKENKQDKQSSGKVDSDPVNT
jgi:hypothetical protein